MSIDVDVIVFGTRTAKAVLDAALAFGRVEDNALNCAGFWFRARDGHGYDPEDLAESRAAGTLHPDQDRPQVRLSCCTNMGWSYYGDTRRQQFPVAHLLAQRLALALNAETAVFDPQDGHRSTVYYRRLDHPEVHAVLGGKQEGFSGNGYRNFCEVKRPGQPWLPAGQPWGV